MDDDTSLWVLEFLLRASVPDTLMKSIISLLPLSNADSRLKKTLLLRTIQTQVSNVSISETLLETLEVIGELDCIDGVDILESMKAAYCAVAVECTVKYLAAGPWGYGAYLDAVNRIWRGRVRDMDLSGEREGTHMLSEELKQWRGDIEAALGDVDVCERLANLNTRKVALDMVNRYLKEVLANLGPPFLELVASLKDSMNVSKTCGHCVPDQWGSGIADGSGSNHDGRHSCEHNLAMNRDEGNTVATGTGRDGSCDRNELDNGVISMTEGEGVDINGDCELPDQRLLNSAERSKKSDAKDLSEGGKETQKGNLIGYKHNAPRGRHKRAKLSHIEELDVGPSSSKDYPLPSAEVEKVREALKSSSLELQAVVEDPLLDALRISEVVKCQMTKRNENDEPPVENQSRDTDADHAAANMSIALLLTNGANQVPFPNMMQRNSTARTYEWDDSIDSSPEGTQDHAKRFHLSSPRTYVISPLRIYEPTKISRRRRVKKWSVLEEDTLRTGVQKFGKGNWKLIRNSYPDIFEERTEVDLKDKWRNMTRC